MGKALGEGKRGRDLETERQQVEDMPFDVFGEHWGGQCGWGNTEAE